MTTGPSAGPASAYPTLRTPASICFSAANEVCDPGLTAAAFAGLASLDCALAEPVRANWAAAIPSAAVPMNWRRFWLMSSGMVVLQWMLVLAAGRGQDGFGLRRLMFSYSSRGRADVPVMACERVLAIASSDMMQT